MKTIYKEPIVAAPDVEKVMDENTIFEQFLLYYSKIKDIDAHIALRNALIDHLCEEYTNLNV